VRDRRHPEASRGQSGAELLGPLAYLLAGVLIVFALVAALPRGPVRETPSAAAPPAPSAESLYSERLTDGWHAVVNALCNDPTLQAEEIGGDCLSGTIILGDDLFDESTTAQLGEEGIRKLHVAITTLLRVLRKHDIVWENLESIELRGHADPRAKRDPYVTNMRVSQQRPMSVMFYLISDWALSERDRNDLERLLVLSAASHARPPKRCPERTRDCYSFWRRVEITPRIMGAEMLSRMYESKTRS
jgi:hypothetical protein